MNNQTATKFVWRKPEIISINLDEYVCQIDAAARSTMCGVNCGGGCGGGGCAWQVSCSAFA